MTGNDDPFDDDAPGKFDKVEVAFIGLEERMSVSGKGDAVANLIIFVLEGPRIAI